MLLGIKFSDAIFNTQKQIKSSGNYVAMGVGVRAIAAEHNYLPSFYLSRGGRNCHGERGI